MFQHSFDGSLPGDTVRLSRRTVGSRGRRDSWQRSTITDRITRPRGYSLSRVVSGEATAQWLLAVAIA